MEGFVVKSICVCIVKVSRRFLDVDFNNDPFSVSIINDYSLFTFRLSHELAQALTSSFSNVDAFFQRIPSSSSVLTRPLASSSSNHLSPSSLAEKG